MMRNGVFAACLGLLTMTAPVLAHAEDVVIREIETKNGYSADSLGAIADSYEKNAKYLGFGLASHSEPPTVVINSLTQIDKCGATAPGARCGILESEVDKAKAVSFGFIAKRIEAGGKAKTYALIDGVGDKAKTVFFVIPGSSDLYSVQADEFPGRTPDEFMNEHDIPIWKTTHYHDLNAGQKAVGFGLWAFFTMII